MRIPSSFGFPLWMMFGIVMVPLIILTTVGVFAVWFLDGYWWTLSPVLLCLVGVEFWIGAKVLVLLGDL
jgi:hypothetical protein